MKAVSSFLFQFEVWCKNIYQNLFVCLFICFSTAFSFAFCLSLSLFLFFSASRCSSSLWQGMKNLQSGKKSSP